MTDITFLKNEMNSNDLLKDETKLENKFKKLDIKSSNKIKNIDEPLDLETLVYKLTKTLRQGHYRDPKIFNRVQNLMETYDTSLGDWKKYAIESKNGKCYSRNLIKRIPNLFTLMLLVWPCNISSPIHDHGGSECWLRVVAGTLSEKFYTEKFDNKSNSKNLKLQFTKHHDAPNVCFINDDRGLHSIGNVSDTKVGISLHCYVPGYNSCNAYFSETNINCPENKKLCKLTFDTIGGSRCEETEYDPNYECKFDSRD